MDVSAGFQIESPEVFVPWGISEQRLRALLPVPPEHVTRGYYVIDCISLGGLAHALGFHFKGFIRRKLVELEFFRRSPADQAASYAEFQGHLEATFGPPTKRDIGWEGFPSFTWRTAGAVVIHRVVDRFGPEEQVRILRS